MRQANEGESREERADVVDATRRTRLAGERTELAWWRTGLTALAVALAVGRVIPELDQDLTRWAYEAVGVCFALYGIAVLGYGSARRRSLEQALDEGRFLPTGTAVHRLLTWGGVALGVMIVLLIVLD
jgi:putative membrane protein